MRFLKLSALIICTALFLVACGGKGGGGNGNTDGTDNVVDDGGGGGDVVVIETVNSSRLYEGENIIREDWDWDNDGKIDDVYFYEYDIDGNVTVERIDEGDDGDLTTDKVYQYIYDEHGNIIEEQMDVDDDGVFETVLVIYSYTYDSEYVTRKECDWSGNGHIDGVYVYDYDLSWNMITKMILE
jgi:hypothetical protein